MTWQPELDELRRRQQLAERMGGPEKIRRQHDAGRLTVRERIALLLDEGSFREIGALAGKASYDETGELADFTPANFVTGTGGLDGRTGDIVIPRVEPQEPLRLELEDFARAIRTGEEPRPNVALGLDIVEAVEMAGASMRDNGVPLRFAPRVAPAAA